VWPDVALGAPLLVSCHQRVTRSQIDAVSLACSMHVIAAEKQK
jgi:hypothetical protein